MFGRFDFGLIIFMVSILKTFVVIFMPQRIGATERMNLCQALTSAMDITMERDSTAGKIALFMCSMCVYTVLLSTPCNVVRSLLIECSCHCL